MNPKQYDQLLQHLFELQTEHGLHVPVCIWGEAGEGKTAIPHQFAKRMSKRLDKTFSCTVIKVSQADGPGDLMGMPTVETHHACPKCVEDDMPPGLYQLPELVRHAHEEHGMSTQDVEAQLPLVKHLDQQSQRFAITDIWPRHGPGVIVLDEINRAPAEIQNSMLGFVQERILELTGYRPPDDVIIVATANPGTSDYVGVNEVDKAMATRFAHFNLRNRPDDWLGYMEDSPTQGEHHGRLSLAFFKAQRDLIGCSGSVENPLMAALKPCPRQAENLVRLSLVLRGELLTEAAIGTLGAEASTAYASFLEDGQNFLRGEQIVRKYVNHRDTINKARADERHDLINSSVDDLLQYFGEREESLNETEMINVATFLADLPGDQVMRFYHEFSRNQQQPARKHFLALRNGSQEFQDLLLRLGADAKTNVSKV